MKYPWQVVAAAAFFGLCAGLAVGAHWLGQYWCG